MLSGSQNMLEVASIDVHYGVIQALHGVSLQVNEGEIVTLIGANGAGKSTTLLSISGLRLPKAGHICLRDQDITNLSPHKRVQLGIVQVPEGRRIFANMTVQENLDLGAYSVGRRNSSTELDRVFGMFPILAERRKQIAGTLSGGEQQMLAIGRGLMSQPKILLLDEPSLGLSPLLVKGIFQTISEIRKQGLTILLVEQNALQALSIADRGYVMETGRVILTGTGEELLSNDEVRRSYLGA